MNLRDLFIIYLACGAPFGVYYFLQNRNAVDIKLLWLKSLLRFVIWIPFAVQMVAKTSFLTKFYDFDRATESDAKKEREIEALKKFFENLLSQKDFPFSIYEFRETFDRYVGLSLELEAENHEVSPAETEIFRITNHGNKKLAEICLNRRNRKRLVFHQKLARRDFLEIFQIFAGKTENRPQLFDNVSKLAVLLNDFEAQRMFENLSTESVQTAEKTNVKNTGEETWTPDIRKPHLDSQISTNLQVLTATTAKLSNKD